MSDILKKDLDFKNINDIYFVNNVIKSQYLNKSKIKNKNNYPLKILFFSNIQESKGIFDLLNAIPSLKKK